MQKGYRHEYKFLISQESARLLKSRLPGFMERDPYAGPTGQYTIRSLYFDDPDHEAFYEKVDGVDNRTKYRIRCYNYELSRLKLERKEKKGHLTRKTAQTVSLADAELFQAGGVPALQTDDLAGELRMNILGGLRPAVVVDYDRTPFVCKAGNTRITLDENLRTVPHCTRLDAPSAGMVPVLEPGEVVMEVKFDDFLPGYLTEVLSDIPKAAMAVSKFALCMGLQ